MRVEILLCISALSTTEWDHLPLTPVAGESYHAILTSSDHVTKRFDLPLVRPEGIVLSAVCYKQLIYSGQHLSGRCRY